MGIDPDDRVDIQYRLQLYSSAIHRAVVTIHTNKTNGWMRKPHFVKVLINVRLKKTSLLKQRDGLRRRATEGRNIIEQTQIGRTVRTAWTRPDGIGSFSRCYRIFSKPPIYLGQGCGLNTVSKPDHS